MDRTSIREIVHLVASLIVLTIAFTYPRIIAEYMAIVAVGVGTGFLLHELAHKFTAQRYGYAADYEASPLGLALALGLSVITNGGFVFAAPGAVMIRGKRVFYPFDYSEPRQSAKEFAYISVSGAVVNLILAISFLVASFFLMEQRLVFMILRTGAFINVFLAAFNMIPFGPLDGAKAWQYDRILWGAVAIPAAILFLLFSLRIV